MFTIMTWNVENLYRPGSKYGPRSPEAYAAKLAALAEVIEAAALDDLTDRLPGTWHCSVSAHPDGRGIRVAWLSRGPLTASRDIHSRRKGRGRVTLYSAFFVDAGLATA